MAVNYFTKWAEVEALANIRDVDVKKFVWRNIVTRFGVLESLVSDNGFNLTAKLSVSFVAALASLISIPPRHIHRATAKPRPPTRPL